MDISENLFVKKHRKYFHTPDAIYFLNHSVGCLPKVTEKSAKKFLNLWKKKGGLAWPIWLNAIHEFNNSLAKLLNASSIEFCPQVNISSAVTKIISSLPKRKSRNKILLSELDFPSMGFVLEQSKKLGYEIEFLQPENNVFSLSQWEKALTKNTQLALITHVTSENSYQNPVAEITNIAHNKKIFTIVDIAQSVGVMPINLQKWSADFVVGTSIKWLCGGPGAAFLWANLEKIDLFLPQDVGWFSHENPFEFDIHNFQYAKDASRFLGGTPSVLPYLLAKSSIDKILEIGIENIYKHNQALLDILLAKLKNLEIKISSPCSRNERGGTCVINFSNNKKMVEKLQEKNILVDCRPRFGIRISPHIYNTRSEISFMCNIFKSLLTS